MALLGALLLLALPSARAQLLGDPAPYFLWPDVWSGTLKGREVLKRDMTMHGASVRMANTTTADAQVRYDNFDGPGYTETWYGKSNTATVDFVSGVFVSAQGHATAKEAGKGQGVVHLDDEFVANGVTIDAGRKTFAIALSTCTVVRCDPLTTSGHTTIKTPRVHLSFGGTRSDTEGVEVVAKGPWPAPGEGLRGRFGPESKDVAGVTDETSLTYDLEPSFAIDAWAAAYRAGYLQARQSDLAPFKKYTAAACGPETLATSPCRAAYVARRDLKANADVATGDFKRVVRALIDRQCPDFTHQLNLEMHRTKDIVIYGPIATYHAVREVLKRTIVSDPDVSYSRLPYFMRCLYPYETYLKVVTLQQPGSNPFPF